MAVQPALAPKFGRTVVFKQPHRTASACTPHSAHKAWRSSTAVLAAQSSVPEQQTNVHNDQAVLIQQLRKEAFEEGFKAGYRQGVRVQVSVSVDLDEDSGSYLRRQRAGPSSRGPRSGSSGQPWLPRRGSDGGETDPPPPAAAAAAAASATAVSSPKAAAATAATEAAGSPTGDSIVRSAVKGLVWRVFSTTVTVSVALVVLQDSLQVSDALKFGGIEFATKYVMYFLHERLWAAIALL